MGNRFLIVASCVHPFFKMRWISESSIRTYATELLRDEMLQVSHNSRISSVETSSSASSTTSSFFHFAESALVESADELSQFLADSDTTLHALQRFPMMKAIFLKFNCATPSSPPVERLFSAASRVRTRRRNRLSDHLFEVLLLLKYNEYL